MSHSNSNFSQIILDFCLKCPIIRYWKFYSILTFFIFSFILWYLRSLATWWFWGWIIDVKNKTDTVVGNIAYYCVVNLANPQQIWLFHSEKSNNKHMTVLWGFSSGVHNKCASHRSQQLLDIMKDITVILICNVLFNII